MRLQEIRVEASAAIMHLKVISGVQYEEVELEPKKTEPKLPKPEPDRTDFLTTRKYPNPKV